MRRLCAVLGRDVSKSLSPMLHEAAARALELDIAYVPISCDDFDRALDALRTIGALGANVTIPYKLDALARCHEVSTTARAIGAVNTLVFDGDTIRGDNTDGPGFLEVLRRIPDEQFARVQVLGDGGAARAVHWALGARGAPDVQVSARKKGTLAAVPGATLIVSTLPKDPAIDFRALVDPGAAPFVVDLAYSADRSPTPLVAVARALGLAAIDGLPLLVEQAALSLAIWTGKEVSRIRDAMLAGLRLYTGHGRE